jgi:hypothetical protein
MFIRGYHRREVSVQVVRFGGNVGTVVPLIVSILLCIRRESSRNYQSGMLTTRRRRRLQSITAVISRLVAVSKAALHIQTARSLQYKNQLHLHHLVYTTQDWKESVQHIIQ